MPTTAGRRTLTFATLDDVMPDVDRLLLGHSTVGKWTLGQICNHLAMDFSGSLNGFAFHVPWIIRKLIAPSVLKRVLKTGVIPEGTRVPAAALPKSGLDDRAEAEALRDALGRYAADTGPMIDHPFFGALPRDQRDHLFRIHCAHHLSFAVPSEAS